MGTRKFSFGADGYQLAAGTTTLSSVDMLTLLGSRIDATQSTAGVQQLKGSMALLSYAGIGVHGVSTIASTAHVHRLSDGRPRENRI